MTSGTRERAGGRTTTSKTRVLLGVPAVIAILLVPLLVQAPSQAGRAWLFPCSRDTLFVVHAASADSFDRNGDEVFCDSEPDYVDGIDNARRLRRAPGGYRFYAPLADRAGLGVTSVNKKKNHFWASLAGQEDDPDWKGCRGTCLNRFFYDRNDFLFVDHGYGSRRVGPRRFERALAGSTRLMIVYMRSTAARNVFSVDRSPSCSD